MKPKPKVVTVHRELDLKAYGDSALPFGKGEVVVETPHGPARQRFSLYRTPLGFHAQFAEEDVAGLSRAQLIWIRDHIDEVHGRIDEAIARVIEEAEK